MPVHGPLPRESLDEQDLSVVDRTYLRLVDAIAAGVYAPGEHLPETRLTRELNVSRGSLREAIRRLHADGVLKLARNRGAVVRWLTYEELFEFLQLRAILEGLAARRTAERIEESGHRRQIALLLQEAEMLSKSKTADDFPAHNERFHKLLIHLSGGGLLRQEWERLHNGRVRLRHLQNTSPSYRHRSLEEHREIALAILDGNAGLAEQLSIAHVEIVKKHIQRLPLEEFDLLVNGVKSAAKQETTDISLIAESGST